MKITRLPNASQTVEEDYSEFEQDDVVSVLSSVCRAIDEFQIARFTSCFADWDERFSKLDFLYDFSSIAVELEDLVEYLRKGQGGTQVLDFYELDRKIHFEPAAEGRVSFSTTDTLGTEVNCTGTIPAAPLADDIDQMLKSFADILQSEFPKAFATLKKEQYVVG